MLRKGNLLVAMVAAAVAVPVFAQEAQAPQGKGVKPILGRVTASAENSVELQAVKHGGGGQQVKVAVETATRVARLEAGSLADLGEGFIVAVLGVREGDKVTANGVLRLAKVDGAPQPNELRGYFLVARGAARVLAHRLGEKDQGGQRQVTPVLGKITALQPLTVETLAARKEGKTEKLEVVTSENTRVFTSVEMKASDLQQGALVAVLPKAGSPEAAPVAAAIVQMPNLGRAAGDKPAKKKKK